ncbi:MAG: hypothetical protein HOO06_01075 [Bdellovibrionaceae bacterium]|jgi:tetratricopeptide (TPR) repeat protein|nr:hypothetical protein [Pseudobdellovibrionaceae bacterium]
MSNVLKKLNQLQNDFKDLNLSSFKVINNPTIKQNKWVKYSLISSFAIVCIAIVSYFIYGKNHQEIYESNAVVHQTPQQQYLNRRNQDINIAIRDLNSGSGQLAEKLLLKYFKSEKENERVTVNLAMSLKKQNKNMQAIEILNSYIKSKGSESSIAHNNLAIIFQSQKKYDLAIAHFKTSYELNNNNPGVILNLAILFEQRGLWSVSNNFYLNYLSHPMARQTLKEKIKKRLYSIQNLAQFENSKGSRYELSE